MQLVRGCRRQGIPQSVFVEPAIVRTNGFVVLVILGRFIFNAGFLVHAALVVVALRVIAAGPNLGHALHLDGLPFKGLFPALFLGQRLGLLANHAAGDDLLARLRL